MGRHHAVRGALIVALVALAAALPSVGCAQLFGLDETSKAPPVPPTVSLTFERVSIGATVVRRPLDFTEGMTAFLRRDPDAPDGLTRTPGEHTAIDTWRAELDPPAMAYFHLPDEPTPERRLWDFPSAAMSGAFTALEHPDPEPPPAGATIAVSVTLPSPYALTQRFELLGVGAWSQRAVAGAEIPLEGAGTLAFTYAYDTSTPIGGPLGRITPADVLAVLRYTGNQLDGQLAASMLDQAEATSVAGTMAAVALDQTLDVRVAPAALATRLDATLPSYGAPAFRWRLFAAPGALYGFDSGPLLHGGNAAAAATEIVATYGNPFVQARGWRTVLTWLAEASRSYTPPALGLPITLGAGFNQKVEPAPELVLDAPAGMPALVSLDGRPLSTDGLQIAQPSTAVEITFITDVQDNTLYQVALLELVPNAATTALETRTVVSASGTEPAFTLPPELFEPGKLYTLRVQSVQGGYPTLNVGDLTNRVLPLTLAFMHSGVFEVMP